MAQAILALQDILVQYGRAFILEVPKMAVAPGEILAIIGPNGAGKSTLLRLMGLLQRPTRGTISFHGQPVNQADTLSLRRRMASVFQEPLLLNAPVYDNVALGLKLRRIDRRTTARRVKHWLARLGIAHLHRRPARRLSGGEAQRASLARALALEPELLLLDEPFAALDPPSRKALILDLEGILRETGTTTVFVTHDRHEALTLGDRVAVLLSGHIVQIGAPWQVFSQPATAAIARFVGAEMSLPGTVETVCEGTARVTTPVGRLEVPVDLPHGTRVTLCLRPEDLTLHGINQALPPSSARNLVRGIVTKIAPWGAQVRVTLDCGLPLVALITRRSLSELGLDPGAQVLATFKASAIHVIRHHYNEAKC